MPESGITLGDPIFLESGVGAKLDIQGVNPCQQRVQKAGCETFIVKIVLGFEAYPATQNDGLTGRDVIGKFGEELNLFVEEVHIIRDDEIATID